MTREQQALHACTAAAGSGFADIAESAPFAIKSWGGAWTPSPRGSVWREGNRASPFPLVGRVRAAKHCFGVSLGRFGLVFAIALRAIVALRALARF